MFSKVLIAEDFDTYNIAVKEALKSLSITEIESAAYCDDALLKIRKGIADGQPFDLLISDLSFKQDHRTTKITSGNDLIAAAKKLQPSLRVIAYSIEDRPHPIRNLFEQHDINGYVLKGRNNIPELKKAIQRIFAEEGRYLSAEVAHVLSDSTLLEIDEYDIELLTVLAGGMVQDDIPGYFKSHNIVPSGKSSVEKRISRLKICLRANNIVHLIAIAKDMGLV